MRNIGEDVGLLLAIADQVDRYTLAHFTQRDYQVYEKADLTPVSDIDRGAEQMIRQTLAAARPDDLIYGEEYGGSSAEVAQARWIIDPIDGTKNFVRGVPVWATLIGLELDGEMVASVVSAPALARRWWAGRGVGSWRSFNGGEPQANQVSKISELKDASLSYSSLIGWEERGKLPAFLELTRKVWRTRAYGDFYSYMLVAEGVVDAAAEPELEIYDMAALVPIVEEAGGCFTSLEGEKGCVGRNALATNSQLHKRILAMLGGK
ncbi:MAG: inositol monophosphatase family protein [Varibaculum cambriense]|uniref:inositol monophosphatase family protein n=1 Tax=Varibaculum cambriense TaxID=184870 RepID=UPI00290013F2|nr:inositol monophosphatase family protein [Varibaculum cambriense]MDU1051084.1 inositol monophosphatase family protein [Varibaculum cambriense]